MQGLSALLTANDPAKGALLSAGGGVRVEDQGAFAALLGEKGERAAPDIRADYETREGERPAVVNLAAIASAELRTASPDSGWAPPSGDTGGAMAGVRGDGSAPGQRRGTGALQGGTTETAGAGHQAASSRGAAIKTTESGQAPPVADGEPGLGRTEGEGEVRKAPHIGAAGASARPAGRAVAATAPAAVVSAGQGASAPAPAPASAGAAKGASPQAIVGAAARASGAAGGREVRFQLRTGAPDAREAQSAREMRHEAFAAQVGRGLASVLRQGGGSVVLRLQPYTLGEMRVRLSIGEGTVSARFEVQTEQARRLLDADMTTLRSALEARGLSVERLDVRFAEAAAERPNEGEPGRQDPWSGSGAQDGGTDDAAERRGERGAGGWNPPERGPRAESAGATDGAAPGFEASEVSGGALMISLGLDAVA